MGKVLEAPTKEDLLIDELAEALKDSMLIRHHYDGDEYEHLCDDSVEQLFTEVHGIKDTALIKSLTRLSEQIFTR